MKIKEQRGITLVAMIITIIMIIGLAGITAALALNNRELYNLSEASKSNITIENEKDLRDVISAMK